MSSQHVRRLVRAGVALSALAAAVGLQPSAAVAESAATGADLQLDLTASQTMLWHDRAEVIVDAVVQNVGSASVDDVTITYQLPPGGEIAGDPWWQCDYATLVCTYRYGALAAGETTSLNVYFSLPVKQEGAEARISATVSTSTPEITQTNNTDQVKTTYAKLPELALRPGELSGSWGETEVPAEGGPITPKFTAENTGTGTAKDVTLVVDLPPGASFEGDGFGGLCTVTDTSMSCPLGTLKAGEYASLTVPMVVAAGTAGDQFTVHGEVSTTSAEWRPDPSHDADVMYRYVESVPAA
ncbi:hypothetical protein V6U81_14665 [Micromonospora sp. CPCC 205711]|uniref:hypothetical protein n=1 Tax=Micromonospora sp. CPCC 205547 TaxID=3122400 RepID=UPI002FF1D841